MNDRPIAWEREETQEPCEAGTQGCAIWHAGEVSDELGCEGW